MSSDQESTQQPKFVTIKGRGRNIRMPIESKQNTIAYFMFGLYTDDRFPRRAPQNFRGSFVCDSAHMIHQGTFTDNLNTTYLSFGFLDIQRGVLTFRKENPIAPQIGYYDFNFTLNPDNQVYTGSYHSALKNITGKATCFISEVPREKLSVLNSILSRD